MSKSFAISLFALLAGLAISTTLSAQTANQAEAQQTTNGPGSFSLRDFTGVWNALRSPYDFSSFSKGDPPMTAWGMEQFKAAKPSQGPRSVLLKDTNDRVHQCYPPGMPYIYLQVFPMEVMQTPKEVVELLEYDHFVRHIYIDGKHPEDLTPTYDGDSIGHWEGDTLVVDTIGLNGKIWLDRVGWHLGRLSPYSRPPQARQLRPSCSFRNRPGRQSHEWSSLGISATRLRSEAT